MVLLVNATCHWSCVCGNWLIETLTESPGLMVSGTGWDVCGSVSTHAWYWVEPEPETVCCVPAWMRSRLVTPPMPTQAASAPADESGVNWGTVHMPLTPLKVPPVAE